MPNSDILIHIDPPLPCTRMRGDNICGRPAHLASATLVDGRHIVRTTCRDCTIEQAEAYNLVVRPRESAVGK